MSLHQRISSNITVLLLTAALLAGCAKTGVPPGKGVDPTRTTTALISTVVEDSTHLILTFSGGLEPKEAQKEENFLIQDEQGNRLEVVGVIQNRADVLTVITVPQKKGDRYILRIINLRDENGILLADVVTAKFTGSAMEDSTSPALVLSYPPHESTGIGILSPITLTFSDLMRAESLADALEMEDDLGQKVAFTLEGEGARFSIIPDQPYDYSTIYYLRLHTTATDGNGNSLYREELVQFTTLADSRTASISGTVESLFGDTTPQGTRLWLSDSQDPTSSSQIIYAQTVVAEVNPQDYTEDETPPPEGAFSFNGLAPTGSGIFTYYLHAAKDQDGDGVEEFLGGLGAKGEVTPLGLGVGECRSGLVVTLVEKDLIGPKVVDAWAEPNPVLYGDTLLLKALISDLGTGDSYIEQVEAFVGQIGSHGTGIALLPALGKLGAGSQAAVSAYIFGLSELGLKEGESLPVFIQAKDESGNWGEFFRVDVSAQKPADRAYFEGMVTFEQVAVAGAVVVAMDGETSRVVSATVADDEGYFRLEAPPGRGLTVLAFNDANGNGQLDDVEARGDVSASPPASNLHLKLMYVPAFGYANARLSHFAPFGGEEERYELFVWALVSDEDYDLHSVTATLPNGSELGLNDEGREGDVVAGDGIYSLLVSLSPQEIPVPGVVGEGLTLTAVDMVGNTTIVGWAQFPGLALVNLDLVESITALDDGEVVNISWQGVDFPERATYIIFIIPKGVFEGFSGPDTGEVWSNFARPTRLTEQYIDRARISGYWGTPSGSRYVVAVAVLGADTRKTEDMDKSWAFVELVRK